MAFQLNNVVPWGRNMEEYKSMFLLNEEDMRKKIAGFGDGPASFNFEAHCLGCDITSYDPIYQFKKEELEKRMDAMRLFLNDFETGLYEKRYRYHELLNCLPVEENYYDIGLS